MNFFDYLAYLQYHSRVGGLEPKDYVVVGLGITVFWYVYASKVKKNNTSKDVSMEKLMTIWVGASAAFFFVSEINKRLYLARFKKYRKEGYDKDDARDHAMMDARNARRHSFY